MTKSLRFFPLSLSLVVLSVCFAGAKLPGPRRSPAPAKAEAATGSAAADRRGAELTAPDLEAFLDGFMPQQIEKADIAGAVISVVKDGKVLFEKGYGYSDVEKKLPVSAQDTLFRPGSISKLFTWTAVMQQVEQGKLDLDHDVNDYLDFKIPPAFGKPITLRDIMTHRSGLEETVKELFVGSEKELKPMAKYLPAHLPARIYAPTTVPAYSNYATTLAAYMVQRVSGQPFEEYVEEHFFKPLGMARATFRQPLPEALKPFMSSGYILGSDRAKPFEYVEVAPAGALSASADSMAQFMIMQLQNGRYGEVQILKPETAVQMHARQEGWPAGMNAMALGFYEQNLNGHRVIAHGGDTQCFHSDLLLLLDANVGLFVSYNSLGRGEGDPRGTLYEKFMDRYFPAPAANQPTLSTAAADAASVAGRYKISRRFETNLLSITTLLGEAKLVADPKDNTLSIEGFFKKENNQPRHFREIGPQLYQAVDGPERIALVKDSAGRWVCYLDYPFMVFQQVESLADQARFNYTVIGFGGGMIVLTILFWPVAALLRKHYGKPLGLGLPARKWRFLVRIFCIVDLLYVALLFWIVSAMDDPGGLGEHGDLLIHLSQGVGLLGGVGALVGLLAALKAWGDSQEWFWSKLWNTLLGLGLAGFFWFLVHWHLLNFNLNY